jgi:uncharacterized tellurite resistance protein B-like protein
MSELETIEDFSLLLLLHMAHVDGSLHPNERETIIERMKEMFPEYLIEVRVRTIEQAYQKLGSVRAEDLLLSSLTRFAATTSEKRKEIFAALFDIINANGRVDTSETHTLQVFKSWLLS